MIESILRTGAIGAAGATTGPAAAAAPAKAGAADFGTVFADVVSSAVNTVKAGEAAAISGLEGRVSTQQAISAIMSAEQTLQAALAVRDKVVSAYQEISRMAI